MLSIQLGVFGMHSLKRRLIHRVDHVNLMSDQLLFSEFNSMKVLFEEVLFELIIDKVVESAIERQNLVTIIFLSLFILFF